MKVDYPVVLNGKSIVVSQECEKDTDVFKFIHHMDELFGNTVCERAGGKSDKIRINIRQDKEENEYFEFICYDPSVPECHFAKRSFGQNKKGGGLFPKNKDDQGNWKPWVKFNKETGKEE